MIPALIIIPLLEVDMCHHVGSAAPTPTPKWFLTKVELWSLDIPREISHVAIGATWRVFLSEFSKDTLGGLRKHGQRTLQVSAFRRLMSYAMRRRIGQKSPVLHLPVFIC